MSMARGDLQDNRKFLKFRVSALYDAWKQGEFRHLKDQTNDYKL